MAKKSLTLHFVSKSIFFLHPNVEQSKKTQNVMTDTIHWLKAKDNAFFVSKQKKRKTNNNNNRNCIYNTNV